VCCLRIDGKDGLIQGIEMGMMIRLVESLYSGIVDGRGRRSIAGPQVQYL
jgi:hypothetical protein